jgi:diaminopimelate decarboxylase
MEIHVTTKERSRKSTDAQSPTSLPVTVLPSHVLSEFQNLTADGPVTGTFIYDVTAAQKRAQQLRLHLPDWAEIYYAVKANRFLPVLQALVPAVNGFEVSSIIELEASIDAAAAIGREARVIATGPGKSAAFLQRLVEHGTDLINVESLLELRRLNRIASLASRQVDVALRVNPRTVISRDTFRSSVGATSAFGLAALDFPKIAQEISTLRHLNLVGLHVHAISGNLNAEEHLRYIEWCLDWSAKLSADLGIRLSVLDCGGGIGVPFQEGEAEFDLQYFTNGLADLKRRNNVRVLFELGRWLVADCGYYGAGVCDVKTIGGKSYVVLSGGIHHFRLPAFWNVIHNFVVVPVPNWREALLRPTLADTAVTVVGELCTSEDTLARDIRIREVRPGDLVVFPKAGAYGWEFSIQEFLGHPKPPRIAAIP